MPMSFEILGAFLVFALVAMFTPGPNNIMLMTSGLNFGFRRALPAMWGVAAGFGFMVLVVGLGLGAVFAAYPVLHTIVSIVGAAYLLYLAWVIGNAHGIKEGAKQSRPVTFFQAVALQWINPKGWIMLIGAVATYAAIAPFPWNVVAMASVFGIGGIGSGWTWVMFGTGLRRVVKNARTVRIVNVCMGLALALSVIPVLFELF
jgi:threonine/homoserine/homoserine lactone efflux protein